MTPPTISPDLYGDIVQTASQPGFGDWLAMVKAIGGCAEPIHLWGESRTIHTATGEVLAEREPGRLLVACGNRRRSRCPPCSETYRADTYQLIRAGLVGGKTVPDTVTDHPKVFATFTAPSFGPVHHRVTSPLGKVKRCHPHGSIRCRRRHRPGDRQLGQPLDPGIYDYTAAVLWNALGTRLWARTVQLVNRHTAHLLGVNQRDWPSIGRVSVAKVAEYQARGVVHFHAVFRLDGPEPFDPAPTGAGTELLCEAIRHAASAARINPPRCDELDALAPVVWGDQIDLRPICPDPTGEGLTDGQVAGYISKYATKGAEASGTIDWPLACRSCAGKGRLCRNGKTTVCERCRGDGRRQHDHGAAVSPHAGKMIDTCWTLGGIPELEHLRLRPWCHMLGFRGHFATKSRRYSTTLGCLRGARQQWRDQRTLDTHQLDPATPVRRVRPEELDRFDPDDAVVLVVGNWTYAGRGHSPGEGIFASTIREDIAESRSIWRQVRHDERERAA